MYNSDFPSAIAASAVVIVLFFLSVCTCNLTGVLPAVCPGRDAACLCDPATGACPCLPNVVGTTCNQCAPGYWDLASGKGCQLCDCETKNTQSNQCNQASKLRCSLGTGMVTFWSGMVGTCSYENIFLSCTLETISLWKSAVVATRLGVITSNVLFYTVTSLANNFSLLVCFFAKWVVEIQEKMIHRKKCHINIRTGKEEV